MPILTEDQKDRIIRYLDRRLEVCEYCDSHFSLVCKFTDLGEAVVEAIEATGVNREINPDDYDDPTEVMEELELTCPTCGSPWESPFDSVGWYSPGRSITLQIPTINDNPRDFDTLFNLWSEVNEDALDVTFDFSHCGFLRQNAVAFLGGLARLIENRGGKFRFNWDSLRSDIRANLAQNGFLNDFGLPDRPRRGNSIPYRQDLGDDKTGQIKYLKDAWLGRDWVNLSNDLMNAIAGRVWEIYANAFEHSESPIGVVSCGQHYPNMHILKLTMIDFGVGIPSNVRRFLRKDYPQAQLIPADRCIKWAFQKGTTTNPNGYGRGLGLDLLKEFVLVNKGSLEIYSHEGYALIDGAQETPEQYQNRENFFEGTLVNITLRCDGAHYQFNYEAEDKPLF